MPGKGRRVASSQARLNQRRRRTGRGPSGIPAPGTTLAGSQPSRGVTPQTSGKAAAGIEGDRREGQPVPTSPLRTLPRARAEVPASYKYVGPELRRILAFAGVVLVILIALGILL